MAIVLSDGSTYLYVYEDYILNFREREREKERGLFISDIVCTIIHCLQLLLLLLLFVLVGCCTKFIYIFHISFVIFWVHWFLFSSLCIYGTAESLNLLVLACVTAYLSLSLVDSASDRFGGNRSAVRSFSSGFAWSWDWDWPIYVYIYICFQKFTKGQN